MNKLCSVLGIEKPIIQGPMAWISTAPLVAAVSNAGGLGVLGVGFAPDEFVIAQVMKTKKLTDKPFGINTVLIPENLDRVTDLIIEIKPPVVYADTLLDLDVDLCKKYFSRTDAVVHPNVKKAVIDSKDMDTVITGYATGEPCRQFKNKLSEEIEKIEAENIRSIAAEKLKPVAESSLKRAMMEGDMDNGAVMAGQIAALINKTQPAAEILDTILVDAQKRLKEIVNFSFQ